MTNRPLVFSGKRLRAAREAKGIGRTRLAHAIELAVTTETISRYEHGLGAPDMNVAAKIAAALEVDLNDLMEPASVES